jgi:UDP-N-acetyl-2-amino-2-deoxyglucuronate dehydrogenase
LRYNPNILNLKSKILKLRKNSQLDLSYITYRGKWYDRSWKSISRFSGGLIMNIGVHFVDILTFLFGKLHGVYFQLKNSKTLKGEMIFSNTKVNFLLSIEKKYLLKLNKPIRKILLNNSKVDLTSGFKNLHEKCYREILSGKGIGIKELELTYKNLKKIQNEIKK